MKKTIATLVLLSTFPFLNPSYVQSKEKSCAFFTNRAINRLKLDKLVLSTSKNNHKLLGSQKTYFLVREDIRFNPKDTPTGRRREISFLFLGKRARNYLASPAILNEIASTILQGCDQYATVTFGLYATSIGTTLGLEADGSIKTWNCYEDLFGVSGRALTAIPAHKYPKWGYDFCSL